MRWHLVVFAEAGVGCGAATMASPSLKALVLVGAMGIKPIDGYIYDQFLVSTEHYAQTAFHDQRRFAEVYGSETTLEQLEAWETDREMTSRVAWKPLVPGMTWSVMTASILRGWWS